MEQANITVPLFFSFVIQISYACGYSHRCKQGLKLYSENETFHWLLSTNSNKTDTVAAPTKG